MDKGMTPVLAVALVALLTGVLGATPSTRVDPAKQILRVGDDLRIICYTGEKINYCRMEHQSLDRNQKPEAWNLKPNSTRGNIEYLGQGFEAGQCGILIRNVQESHNGNFRCTIGLDAHINEAVGEAEVIVAHSPQEPELVVQSEKGQYEYSEGYQLRATCTIRDGRPVSNMSWYLDDRPLEVLTVPTITENKQLYTIIQNYSRTLSFEDNGKKLQCVAQHLALNRRNQSSFQINVRFAPRTKSNPLELFGFEVDQPVEISVEVQAFPKPNFEWIINDDKIPEGSSDSTGRINAEPAKELGKGNWNVTLRIAPFEAEDSEKTYKLIAKNQVGESTFNVRISTSLQRSVMEMGAGTIIGIVAAILVLLLIIFLVVFARATGRWCFAAHGAQGQASHSSSEAHIETGSQHKEGTENPSANHNVSSEYINGNQEIKKDPKDDKDTPV